MKAKLEIYHTVTVPHRWNWEIRWAGLYICADVAEHGYSRKADARRAAINAAGKLGLDVKEVRHG